jgi:Fe-S-cluster formation regulator IscX/YfhJ
MERLAEKLADIWKEHEDPLNITFTGIHKGILVKDDDIQFSNNRFILYFLVKNFSVFFHTGILLENDKIQY